MKQKMEVMAQCLKCVIGSKGMSGLGYGMVRVNDGINRACLVKNLRIQRTKMESL